MPLLPFDPVNATDGFSNVAALLSGFALAAFFLLIERLDTSNEVARRAYTRALVLLLVSFLAGSVTSFMYASVMGETDFPERAMYAFMFPNNTFAITTYTLLCGLNMVISAFGVKKVLQLSRFLFGIILFFGIARLQINTFLALDFFGTNDQEKLVILIAGFIPFLVSIVIVLFFKKLRLKLDWTLDKRK